MSEWLQLLPTLSDDLREKIEVLERMRKEDQAAEVALHQEALKRVGEEIDRRRGKRARLGLLKGLRAQSSQDKATTQISSEPSCDPSRSSRPLVEVGLVSLDWTSRASQLPRGQASVDQGQVSGSMSRNAYLYETQWLTELETVNLLPSQPVQKTLSERWKSCRDATSPESILPIIPTNILQALTLYVPDIIAPKKRYPSLRTLGTAAQQRLMEQLNETQKGIGFLPLNSARPGKPICCRSNIRRQSSALVTNKKREACEPCQASGYFCIQMAYGVAQRYIAPLPRELRCTEHLDEAGYWIMNHSQEEGKPL